ncbi:MAG: enoyl-CoA hydratase/isomerase family protein [Ilumatobacteraceae bacterium]
MSLVETATNGGVCTVTLADEARRNALSGDLVAELMAALDAAEADDSVRVIVLTNRGSVFCAGANLAERSEKSDETDRSTRPSYTPAQLFSRFHASPKPYVGRIAGHCVAGGMGLAAAMDVSIAIDTAKMGFTEVRIGVAPAMISVLCLPKMREADARAAFLRGNRLLAPEAARIGLITAAVPSEMLDIEVGAVVEDLLAGSPAALAAAKQLCARIPSMSTDDAFAWTEELSAELFRSEDAREGMTAYLEKRPASWIPQPD